MFCKKCGRMLDDDEQICPFCGENESDKNIQMNIPPENIDANNFAPIKITPYQNMYSDGTVNMGEKSRLTAGLQNAGMPTMNVTAGAMNTNMTGAGEQNGGWSRENGVAQGQNAGISRQETLADDESEDNEFLDFSFGL